MLATHRVLHGASNLSYDATILADSPVFFLPLNESSGTTATDATGNGHNGTYAGGYTLAQTGIGDGESSVLLNGSTGHITTSLTITNGPVLPFSIEAWYKTSSGAPQAIAEFNSTGAAGGNESPDVIIGEYTSGAMSVRIWIGSSVAITDTSLTDDGLWHAVVATFGSSGAMTLYIDGVSVGSNTNSSWSPFTGSWEFGTGFAFASGGSYLSGYLAKCAYYNYALTSSQVAAHYAAA